MDFPNLLWLDGAEHHPALRDVSACNRPSSLGFLLAQSVDVVLLDSELLRDRIDQHLLIERLCSIQLRV